MGDVMDRDQSTPTPRQLEVLAFIAKGLDTREAAEALGMPYDTARTHRQKVIERLGARNATHAVAMAYEADWWRGKNMDTQALPRTMLCSRCHTEWTVPRDITPEQYDALSHGFAMRHTECQLAARPAEVSWAVFDADEHFMRCERCGAREPQPQLPMDLMEFVGFLHDFIEQHRSCLP